MDQNELENAQEILMQNEKRRSKKLLWLIIGIILGIIITVGSLLFLLIRLSSNGSDNYPYIPTPKHTIRSISGPDLITNLIMDTNEVAPLYSLISRQDLIK